MSNLKIKDERNMETQQDRQSVGELVSLAFKAGARVES
jgi:hypothetical protein